MFDVIHWTSITVYIHIKCMLKNCIQRCDMSIYILIITRKSIYKCIYTYQIYCVFISPYFVWICSHHFPFGNILHPKSIPSEKPPPSALQLLVGVKLWSSDFGFSVSPHFVVPFSLGMMPRSVNTYIYTHFWGVEKNCRWFINVGSFKQKFGYAPSILKAWNGMNGTRWLGFLSSGHKRWAWPSK